MSNTIAVQTANLVQETTIWTNVGQDMRVAAAVGGAEHRFEYVIAMLWKTYMGMFLSVNLPCPASRGLPVFFCWLSCALDVSSKV